MTAVCHSLPGPDPWVLFLFPKSGKGHWLPLSGKSGMPKLELALPDSLSSFFSGRGSVGQKKAGSWSPTPSCLPSTAWVVGLSRSARDHLLLHIAHDCPHTLLHLYTHPQHTLAPARWAIMTFSSFYLFLSSLPRVRSFANNPNPVLCSKTQTGLLSREPQVNLVFVTTDFRMAQNLLYTGPHQYRQMA